MIRCLVVLGFAAGAPACSGTAPTDGGSDVADAAPIDVQADTSLEAGGDGGGNGDASLDGVADVTADSPSVDGADASSDGSVDVGSDGGALELCGAMLVGRAGACGPADVGLSVEICRCGSRYYWDGTSCFATAACRCTRNCDLLFDTRPACERAYAMCLSDASRAD